ncbi:MAG TPA: hypothetical protein VGH28_19190 [Polyangiaceae bacterium]|jgi:hypothetical protein
MRALCIFFFTLAACSTSSNAPDASTDAGAEASAPRANGTVGAWQTLAPLPHARANFCATVVGSFVVTIGGNYADDGGFTKLDEIDVARFHDDGSLDAWQVAGHTPSPVTECTAAGLGSTLYVLDGIYDDTSKEGHVFSADLASDSTLGTLSDSGMLPAGVDLFDDLGFAAGGTVWSTYSALDGTCDLLRLGGGPLPFLSEFRGRPQWASAVAGGATFAYVLGGYSDADAGNAVLTSGAGAQITGTTIASPVAVDDLPKPTTFGMAASADDWVFVIGGRDAIFGSQPRTDVIAGQADATGHLGGWTAQASLPSPRSNACAVVAGNFLYVLGGANSSATDTVYAAQVRF